MKAYLSGLLIKEISAAKTKSRQAVNVVNGRMIAAEVAYIQDPTPEKCACKRFGIHFAARFLISKSLWILAPRKKGVKTALNQIK